MVAAEEKGRRLCVSKKALLDKCRLTAAQHTTRLQQHQEQSREGGNEALQTHPHTCYHPLPDKHSRRRSHPPRKRTTIYRRTKIYQSNNSYQNRSPDARLAQAPPPPPSPLLPPLPPRCPAQLLTRILQLQAHAGKELRGGFLLLLCWGRLLVIGLEARAPRA